MKNTDFYDLILFKQDHLYKKTAYTASRMGKYFWLNNLRNSRPFSRLPSDVFQNFSWQILFSRNFQKTSIISSICFDLLHSCQQYYNHVGTGLPGLVFLG